MKGFCPGSRHCWVGFSDIYHPDFTVEKNKFYVADSTAESDGQQHGDKHAQYGDMTGTTYGGNGPWFGGKGFHRRIACITYPIDSVVFLPVPRPLFLSSLPPRILCRFFPKRVRSLQFV